jgi:hypothetical protein
MADPDPLADLIASVADGTLDRRQLPDTHHDPSISRLLAELKILAGVSEVHRSDSANDESTRTDDVGDHGSLTGSEAGQTAPETAPAVAGTLWGNFELIRKVGEGTFGEVFLARDLWLGHDVALKLLRANITDKAKMLQEARMLVRVRHPHVVTVHGADVQGGRLGFWMDFVDGVTLHDAVRRDGRRSASEAVAWGQELCRALAAVHAAGIVHRDVKAQNVMRQTGDGRLILMDFGAGELLDARRPGTSAGTPLYLAPELLHGEQATPSSDIYALGVLLFYVVSRQFPVRGTTLEELVGAHQEGARLRLEDVRPDLPSSFVDVVEKALSPRPAARYSSAGEMLAAIRSGSDTGPLIVTPPGPLPVRVPPPSPVWLFLTRLGGAGAALLVLALGLGYVACTAFETAMQIGPDFASGPADYLRVGREALFPFLWVWTLAWAAVASLGGVKYLLQDRLARWRSALGLPDVHSVNPTVLGGCVCAAGFIGLTAISAWFNEVFAVMDLLRTARATPMALAAFAPGGANSDHGVASAILSFLLGFAAWKWFPGLERRDPAPPMLRSLKWATVGVALLAMGLSVIPRRVVWDEFEVVQYEKQRAFVLGDRGDELLLYFPASPARPWRRVNPGAKGLDRSGVRDKLFSPPS